ncbi:MAG: SDR family NAD(P)-dependent oxidoreductase [Acidimicrobiia bacterium]
MDQLRDKTAVITGGASGIGFALAERFAAEGMRLVLADIEEVALEGAAKRIADADAEVLAVPTDVADADAVDALATATFERFGTAHVVCNNAGVVSGGPAWEIPLAEWEWILGVNLEGVVHGIRSFVPRLIEQGEGHVVNTASIAGIGPLPFVAPYNATKHAVVGISASMYHELALIGSPVGVTVLCPGFVPTKLLDAGRNWPERLGPRREVDDDPIGQFVSDLAQSMMDVGPPLTVLSEKVVDAIENRRFLVTTDEELARKQVLSRLEEIDGADPVLPEFAP